MRIVLGEFTLDVASRQLFRGAEEIRVRTKAFELLEMLARRRPRALSRAQIRDGLWAGTHVSESNLATLVGELRAALGDSARHPRYIRTIHGFGYALCAAASASKADGPDRRFRLLWGEREIPLAEGDNVVGRADDIGATIEAATVSRHHALIAISGARAVLEDLGSKNGTYVEGERLGGARVLSDGDVIRLGRVRVTFRSSSSMATTETESRR